MAGKTATKPKVKKEEPKKDISATYIDDILFRLDTMGDNMDGVVSKFDDVIQKIDGLDTRVGKVEARLGIG